MAEPSTPSGAPTEPKWLTDLVVAEPRAPLMAPFMAYLLLLLLKDAFPTRLQPLSIVLHIALAAWVTWFFRHHYPPWGKLKLGRGIVVGLIAAWLWVAGQHLLEGIQIGSHTLGESLSATWRPPFVRLHGVEPSDPHVDFGSGGLFWVYVVSKICRAVTIVPIVEEIFWRGFMLRALVRWDRFDLVPWGKFSWVAFLGSSLLSVLQHPGNWGVSIACWMLFNALFYWTRSLSCLMVTHAVTNLALYAYVLRTGRWEFW